LEKKDESRLLKDVEALCQDLYATTVKQLSRGDRLKLAIRLWNEGKTTSIKQLARLTRNNEDVLRTILHVPKKE